MYYDGDMSTGGSRFLVFFLMLSFSHINQPIFGNEVKTFSVECTIGIEGIFNSGIQLSKQFQQHDRATIGKYSYGTSKEAKDFVLSIDSHLTWLEKQGDFSKKFESDILEVLSQCPESEMEFGVRAGIDRLLKENEQYRTQTLEQWRSESRLDRSVAMAFLKFPTQENLRKVRENQLIPSFLLEVRCYPPENLSELVCSASVGRTVAPVILDVDVDVQVSTKKGVWRTLSTRSIPFNKSKLVSIPHKLSKFKEVGEGKLRLQSLFGGKTIFSSEIEYSPVLYPPPWPKWVENCISWDKGIVVNGSRTVSRCDQAYATGPGKWVKNCPVKYNRTLKLNIRECVQAYVTDKK